MKRPCEHCGSNRWRTVIKGKIYQCRKCGEFRKDEHKTIKGSLL